CPMCAGAAYWTQISRIVYGAADPKRGFSGISKSLIHPKTEIKGGVLADEAGALIQKFFIERRKHYQTNN
ncbi:MAG: nucleoside deaminase, partial [Bacteroidetes bacterium]|nr:nucleoside deaminase [Bacteroidota bacterium]